MIEVLTRMRLPVTPTLPDEVARLGDIITGDAPNYSLTPVNTQVRWVDGQFVWRRVFILVSGLAANSDYTMLHIPGGWGFHGLVRLDGYVTRTDEHRIPVGYWGSASDYFSVRINANGDIIERHAGTNMSSRPVIIILDYISAPTGTSSWDGGISLWDAGTSTWDQ